MEQGRTKAWTFCTGQSATLHCLPSFSLSSAGLDHWELTIFKHFSPILVWLLLSYNMRNARSEPVEECGLQSMDCFVFGLIIFWYFQHKSQCDGWNSHWQNYSGIPIWNFEPQVVVKVTSPECYLQSSHVPVGKSDKLIWKGVNSSEQVSVLDHPNLICFVAAALNALLQRRVYWKEC